MDIGSEVKDIKICENPYYPRHLRAFETRIFNLQSVFAYFHEFILLKSLRIRKKRTFASFIGEIFY
jgi:hypothetical protein